MTSQLPPEPILQAILETLHMATVQCRNWTAGDEVSRKQVYELMEAVHAIPQIAQHWSDRCLEEIRTHLSSYDASKWSDGFSPIVVFEDALERNNRR